MKRVTLRSKEVNKELVVYEIKLGKKDIVELVENDHFKILFVNKQPSFFYYNDAPIPTLKHLQNQDLLKKIIVDMGAIKFVVKGADIMRPGIVEIEEGITKDEAIVVIDVNNKRPLAVGIALFDTAEMKAMSSGKVIKNIHYVGDELWKTE